MKKAIIYLVSFIALQLIVAMAVKLVGMLFGNTINITGTSTLVIMQMAISILTVILFLCTKWSVVSGNYLRTRPWFTLFWCVLAAAGAVIPSTWLQMNGCR